MVGKPIDFCAEFWLILLHAVWSCDGGNLQLSRSQIEGTVLKMRNCYIYFILLAVLDANEWWLVGLSRKNKLRKLAKHLKKV